LVKIVSLWVKDYENKKEVKKKRRVDIFERREG